MSKQTAGLQWSLVEGLWIIGAGFRLGKYMIVVHEKKLIFMDFVTLIHCLTSILGKSMLSVL